MDPQCWRAHDRISVPDHTRPRRWSNSIVVVFLSDAITCETTGRANDLPFLVETRDGKDRNEAVIVVVCWRSEGETGSVGWWSDGYSPPEKLLSACRASGINTSISSQSYEQTFPP